MPVNFWKVKFAHEITGNKSSRLNSLPTLT